MNQDKDWRKWYDDMSGLILKIQNEDGSWNGHHCITSPVFCTSAALQVPLGFVYLVLPLSGLLMMFYSAMHGAEAFSRLRVPITGEDDGGGS